MYVILSQKVDTDSSYSDVLFNVYHYPSRYKNQLKEGDVFVYYQGNRYSKQHRYYFGTGRVDTINTEDGENYFATLTECKPFSKKVSIYHPAGGYIEQMGYQTIRKSPVPPWRSSIRPLSAEAYNYILDTAKLENSIHAKVSVHDLKEDLKIAIRKFYLEGCNESIHSIINLSSTIADLLKMEETQSNKWSESTTLHSSSRQLSEKYSQFVEYCIHLKMTYSYKPVVLLAFFENADRDGKLSIEGVVDFVRNYYDDRRLHGLLVERKKSIYQDEGVSDNQIKKNLISNPIQAFVKSNFFNYDQKNGIFSIIPEVWASIGDNEKSLLNQIFVEKLRDYFSE